ncbi:MAG: hypothetical protein ACO3FJ_08865 [Ilumatobacteraceae bacterium]
MKEYKNESGQYHRTDGPAIEWNNGDKWWFINGELHREDGPAIECSDGSKEWYLNGIEYSEDQFHQELIKLKLKRIVEL